jgi:hypothetical protein
MAAAGYTNLESSNTDVGSGVGGEIFSWLLRTELLAM